MRGNLYLEKGDYLMKFIKTCLFTVGVVLLLLVICNMPPIWQMVCGFLMLISAFIIEVRNEVIQIRKERRFNSV